MKKLHDISSDFRIFLSSFKRKNIYKVSKKLRILMALEISLLTIAFIVIIFFYTQNYTLQQNNKIYHLNQSLLLQSNSTLEKIDTSLDFPLAHIADRYQDPLLKYLIERDHGGISETDFYRTFVTRASEVFIQFPDVESILLFDVDGNLLDSKTMYNLYIPSKNYSGSSWYQNCLEKEGKIHILSEAEIEYLEVRKTSQNFYGARLLYDHLTLQPLCITLVGIRGTDIPVVFETSKDYEAQQYAIFDSYGQKLLGDLAESLDLSVLQQSIEGDYHFETRRDQNTYIYHVSYSAENNGVYSVIRTPKQPLLLGEFYAVLGIFLAGLLLIVLNISIFAAIIRSINQPLNRLVYMCEEIGRGNFSIRVPCPPTDELSYLTASLNSMSSKIEQLVSEVYVKNLTKRDLELQMLRSQINPHFLYNTLENMRMSAYTKGYVELSEMCLLLSKVLRYGVSEQSRLVSVREELEHLKDYTDLLHYCLPGLQVHVFVDEMILDYSIIKVILQPLVENSVNHASKNSRSSIQIQIWGYEENTDLLFTVSDNGDGIEASYLQEIIDALDNENDTSHGIGLKNIHRRIRLYYGEHYGLTIKSSPGRGTSVTVRLPKSLDEYSLS